MVLSEFIDYATKFKWVDFVGMEDFADKLSFSISTSILLLLTLIITVKSYLLNSIACYIPIHPSGKDFDDFLKSYCWVHGTIPIQGRLPQEVADWDNMDKYNRINYYQWVPFVLAIQGILFYLPRIIWQMITYNLSGTDLEGLVEMANSASNLSGDAKKETVNQVAMNLENLLFVRRKINLHSVPIAARLSEVQSWFCSGKRSGRQLTAQYMFIKVLYVINAFGQLFLMQYFLDFGHKGSSFGYDVLSNIINGKEWNETLIFPRVTYCYVKNIQHIGMKNSYLAQCALPINMLNEKIYIFLWFWTIIVVFFTCISFIQWIYRLTRSNSQVRFLKKFLRIREQYSNEDDVILKSFFKGFLRKDGVFILRMFSINAGDLITADIVTELWNIYKENHKDKNFGKIEPSTDDIQYSDTSTLPLKDEFI